LQIHYGRAAGFRERRDWLYELYLGRDETRLSEINRVFLEAVNEQLGIRTPLRWSWEYPQAPGRSERLVSICRAAGATEYLSGPRARGYLDEAAFADAGIAVTWMDYDGYAPYRQLHPPFDGHMSILDLLLNEGADSASYVTAAGPAAGLVGAAS
jgi:hypothetical protein